METPNYQVTRKRSTSNTPRIQGKNICVLREGLVLHGLYHSIRWRKLAQRIDWTHGNSGIFPISRERQRHLIEARQASRIPDAPNSFPKWFLCVFSLTLR